MCLIPSFFVLFGLIEARNLQIICMYLMYMSIYGDMYVISLNVCDTYKDHSLYTVYSFQITEQNSCTKGLIQALDSS